MKNTRTAAAVMALTLGFATLAPAQPRDSHDDRRGGPPQSQQRGPGGSGDRGDRGGPDRRVDYRGDDRRGGDMRGAGPDHNWRRGDRLPAQYRSHQYVVDDWRGHRLSAPPRGYQWVQNGGDYVLVAIATGVIASLILNN